jgi:hypothetical protein
MSRPTVAFSCRLPQEIVEALKRSCAIANRSQPQLLEAFIQDFEDIWLPRFNVEERRRYDALLMSPIEAREIRRRAMAAGAKPAEQPTANETPHLLGAAEHSKEDAA